MQALVQRHGPHGLYVANALYHDLGEVLVFAGEHELLGIGWFGPRGNLILLLRQPLDAEAVAVAVERSHWHWRIALGPQPLVDALAARAPQPPLVHRDQVYYAAAPADAAKGMVSSLVRRPVKKDRDRLMQATLQLNDSDLRVDPARVDRAWLRQTVMARIDDGSTRVIGQPGMIQAKLDFGSDGPAGLMLEGVFTFAEARGRGLASRLVATAVAEATVPQVCLHVDKGNAPARAAYERAGMRVAQQVRLLLLG